MVQEKEIGITNKGKIY